MELLEKAVRAHEFNACEHCSGRVFAKLLHGTTNKERGKSAFAMAEMQLEAEGKKAKKPGGKCSVCKGLFEPGKIRGFEEKAVKAGRGIGFESFMVSTRLSKEIFEAEQGFLDSVGREHSEPLKQHFNRELGKLLEKRLGKEADRENPEIVFIADLRKGSVEASISPLFVYGEYQKLARGIPQTKWRHYKTSVEQEIAKPFVKGAGAEKACLHGMGREDVDVRCLGWRPFVLEIKNPKKRRICFSALAKKAGKKVRVRKARASSMKEVRGIKSAKPDKTYRCVVECGGGLAKKDLGKLGGLVGEIEQRTPHRVAKRRADLVRKRKVASIKTRKLGEMEFEAVVRAGAGTYIKELVSGDRGRTPKSFSSVLGRECRCKELDVTAVHY